ncbi:hypothetical protein [Seonamhaeicola sp.]|uniref:hypothetical protein n=1 Tax=Seonamhaeicola sp. TaxID=1912245 RepID=UPI0035622570
MDEIIEYLEKKIQTCDEIGGMQLEKFAFIVTLKKVRKVAMNYKPCCTQLPTIIEIDFDGHLKCQIETTDKAPIILKAVNGYGQPVDCNKEKIRINEI